MSSITSDEVNYLIYRYLQEAGTPLPQRSDILAS